MGILIWVVFGLVAGAVARLVMPGPPAGGMAVAIPLGIVGALIGGVVGAVFGDTPLISFDFGSLLFAIIGALFTLFAYRSYALTVAT